MCDPTIYKCNFESKLKIVIGKKIVLDRKEWCKQLSDLYKDHPFQRTVHLSTIVRFKPDSNSSLIPLAILFKSTFNDSSDNIIFRLEHW